MSSDAQSSPSAEPVDASSDLADHVLSAQHTAARASENWGLESRRSIPPLSPRLIGSLVSILLVVLASPFVFMRMKPSDTTMRDDAYYALEAYSRALAANSSLETDLSASERALIASASRLETKDGSLLVLRGEFACWGVSTTPSEQYQAPKELDPEFCP